MVFPWFKHICNTDVYNLLMVPSKTIRKNFHRLWLCLWKSKSNELMCRTNMQNENPSRLDERWHNPQCGIVFLNSITTSSFVRFFGIIVSNDVLKEIIFPLTETNIFAPCLWSRHDHTQKKWESICKLTFLF